MPEQTHRPEEQRPGPVRSSRRRRAVFALVSAALGLGLAVVGAEVLVRLLAPQPVAGIMYSGDSTFGFWNRAGLKGKVFQSEATRPPYAITTDAAGYRIHPPMDPRPDRERLPTRRIVLAGDSFVFGVGVANDETLPARLEAALNGDAARSGKPVRYEVINAGCPGWGTENILAFWTRRGRALNADLLIVAFYRNDLEDNSREMVYRIEEGRAVYSPSRRLGILKKIVRSVPFYEFLAERSHFLNLLRRAAAVRLTRPGGDAASRKAEERGLNVLKVPAPGPETAAPEASEADRLFAEGREAELRSRLAFYGVLMESLFEEARDGDTPVGLLLLPGVYECVPRPIPDYSAVAAVGRSWVEEGKAALFIDPLEVLAAAREEGSEVFQPADGHYTAGGNDLVARSAGEAILRWFGAQGAGDSVQPAPAGEPLAQRSGG